MTRGPTSAPAKDDGVVIVWALALVSVLLLIAAAGALIVGQATVRMRAAAVADLAALAAAQAPGDGCAAAADVAVANGLVLAGCGRDGSDIVVTVSAELADGARRLMAALGGDIRSVSASARAGPP